MQALKALQQLGRYPNLLHTQKSANLSRNMMQFTYVPQYNLRIFKVKNEGKTPEGLEDCQSFEEGRRKFENPVHNLVKPGKEKFIGAWLLLVAGGVFAMIGIGGYTRLSGSGLSMTRWKPIQPQMPQTAEQWDEEFEHYKQFPEYQLKNKGMDVEGFKKIFFFEWFHRLLGSSLGVAFGAPFAYFLARGYFKRAFLMRMGFLFALGGTQGLIGWWMVKSGMKDKPDYQQIPRVSVYRLTIHLNTALVLYGGLVWNGLTLLRKPQEYLLRPENFKATKSMRLMSILLLHCIAFNTISGAITAGIDAGKVFNDWPWYNNKIFPPEMFKSSPFWHNFFENRGLVQFNHRNFGYLTMTVAGMAAIKGIRMNLRPMQKAVVLATFGLVCAQAAGGIVTLKRHVGIKEANGHQMMAIIVLSSAILLAHTCRMPSSAFTRYLKQFM